MARIHLIDGEKGGVGKSLFARVMVQYCLDRGLPYTLVDADITNPDVKRFYPKDAKDTVFSEAQKKSHEADLIFDLAMSKPVIVNLPAQVYPLVTNWIEEGRLLEIGSEYGIDICKWFVCNGGYDSVQLFKESMSHFGEKMCHIFVRNMGLTDEWGFLEDDEDFVNLKNTHLKSGVMKIIDFPQLTYKERYYLDAKQLNFEAARKEKKMPVLSKQRLHTFLEKAHLAIEGTQLLDPECQPVKVEKVEANV